MKELLKYFVRILLLAVITPYSYYGNAAFYQGEESPLEEGDPLKQEFSFTDIMQRTQNAPQPAQGKRQSKKDIQSNYNQVIEWVKEKKYDIAREKVDTLLKQYPEQSVYYNLKALFETLDKNIEAAEKSFYKAIELSTGNFQAYTGLAKIELDRKNYAKAEEFAENALRIFPYDTFAYKVLSPAVYNQRGIDAVENRLLEAREKVKNHLFADLEILKLLGKVYIIKKQPEKLLPMAEDLAFRSNNHSDALSFLAGIQIINRDFEGAEKSLRQIISQEPTDAKHRLMLARLVNGQAGKEAEVMQLLDQAEKNLKNTGYVLAFKTTVLIKQNKYDQALAVANQAESSYPALSLGKVLKGDIYMAQKKIDEALRSYRLAYQKQPNLRVLDVIVAILTKQKKQDEAIDLLKGESAKNKDDANLQLRLANAYLNAGKYDLSIKSYENLLNQKKHSVIVLNNLAWAYNQQNDPKALSYAERAYRLAPKSVTVTDTYGYILLKQGDQQKSLAILKQAADLAPNFPEIQLHLAEAYAKNQNRSEAKVILQHLIDQGGEVKEAANALLKQM